MADDKRGGFPEREKTILDHPKFTLSAFFKGNEKPSTLRWRFTSGEKNPGSISVYVYTNVPDDQTDRTKNGLIEAKLPLTDAQTLIAAVEQVIRSKENTEVTMECSNFIYPAGKKSEKPVIVAYIAVGRDDEGVYIGVYDYKEDRPRIKFYFNSAFDAYNKVVYHRFRHSDGTPFTKAETSTLYATGYAKTLSAAFNSVSISGFRAPEPPQRNGGGNGGGGGRGNYGGGGGDRGGNGGGYGRQESAPRDEPASGGGGGESWGYEEF